MAREVVWTLPALDDLDQNAEFIARDDPYYAEVWVEEILERADSLSTLAERGRHISEIRDEALRELTCRSHRLMYRVKSDRVEIVALIHGRRDFSRAWTEKTRE